MKRSSLIYSGGSKADGSNVPPGVLALVALIITTPVFLPLAAADEMKASSFSATFVPDSRFTLRGGSHVSAAAEVEVFNLTADDVPLNLETWPNPNGTYSGAMFRESVLQVDYLGVEKTSEVDPIFGTVIPGTTPYSYVALGSVFNWTTRDFMNGPVRTTVRLPWVGDNYDFMAFRVYEVDTPASASLSVKAVENGSVPVVTGGGANLIYENYPVMDWWHDIGIFTEYFFWPDELHSLPWRMDPVEGIYTNDAIIGGPVPYAMYRKGASYSTEVVGDRFYVDMHLYLEPDKFYYFTTAAILKDSQKPSIGITEENHSGGSYNFTIIQGHYDGFTQEEEMLMPGLDLGWSFLFKGGHGAGLTGLQIPAVQNQTVQFRVELDPADGTTDNFSLMLPLINEGDEFFYGVSIYAFNATGHEVEWHNTAGPTYNHDSIFDGHQFGDYLAPALKATHFILYTPRCLDGGVGFPAVFTVRTCIPNAGATHYDIQVTFNHKTNDTLYQNATDYRLLAHQGDAGFLVDNSYGGAFYRAGGEYYAYNLSFSAKYTEGSWNAPLPSVPPALVLGDFDINDNLAHAGLDYELAFLGAEGGVETISVWSNLAHALEKFVFDDPSTWHYVAEAMESVLMTAIRPLWNGMEVINGNIHGAFSATADYLQQLGHFTQVYLGAIYDTVVNIMVHVYDLFTDILEKVLLLIGGIVFYFGLRLLLLVASYIKLALAGRPFE